MIILAIVFVTAIVAGYFFWTYNKKQVSSLTEKLEDKNAVINSFRDHLTHQPGETPTFPTELGASVTKTEKKKKKYYNNQKKDAKITQPNQKNQNSEKKNKPRKPKTQQ